MEDLKLVLIYFLGLFAGILTGLSWVNRPTPGWVNLNGREAVIQVPGNVCDTVMFIKLDESCVNYELIDADSIRN